MDDYHELKYDGEVLSDDDNYDVKSAALKSHKYQIPLMDAIEHMEDDEVAGDWHWVFESKTEVRSFYRRFKQIHDRHDHTYEGQYGINTFKIDEETYGVRVTKNR